MDAELLTYIFVIASFVLYIVVAIWSRAASTHDFYVAGGGVRPIVNGMATAADWISAASIISLAGIVSMMGHDASSYIMGWTGGYVLLALLLVPYLRKFGKFTVPDFIGERYYSTSARVVAVVCLLCISFAYIAGQLRGAGIVFSRFMELDIETGIYIGTAVTFVYAVLGGMKGITYTQVAQYCVMLFAFNVPAIFLTFSMTGHLMPQTGLGANLESTGDAGLYVLDALDNMTSELGFTAFTQGSKSPLDMFFITAALMFGTASLPHVIVRFFTVPRVRDARVSVAWALIFTALIYTAIPAVGALGQINLIKAINGPTQQGTDYQDIPTWFDKWEKAGLLAWYDSNGDGKLQIAAGPAINKQGHVLGGDSSRNKSTTIEQAGVENSFFGQSILSTTKKHSTSTQPFANEVYVDPDIMALANPEIAKMPAWVIALIAAGALAAALSTASGLLLVIATAVAHDLVKNTLRSKITDIQELNYARLAAVVSISIASYLAISLPGSVVSMVALSFGLACAAFFPAIIMGIFYKKMNKYGAISGMLVGLLSTLTYIVYFDYGNEPSQQWLLGISPHGFGAVGMLLNFLTAYIVSHLTPLPPKEVQQMVMDIRMPSGYGSAYR